MARKPVEGTVADNMLKYGVGGINIDECRVGDEIVSIHNAPVGTFAGGERDRGSDTNCYRDSQGRFPANVILKNFLVSFIIIKPFRLYILSYIF